MVKDGMKIKGFARLQIIDKKTKKIVGDSGWGENVITNYGLNTCLVACPIGATGSLQAGGLMLGSGQANPATDDTSLISSNTDYWQAFDTSTVIDSLTARMIATFDGAAGAATLQNIGVFVASTGSLLAGKTFASSALTTDQDVNATYEIRYARA